MLPGARFQHYEVLSAIGRGGMGEVWKARDTKLQRDVAIKTLPEAFANDPERVARFGREATLLAALNHPNIAAIYGFERFESTRFLVLELVDGETLADRLRAGPLQANDALKLALQIANALEAAHEKRIIHKDLKPANVKVDRNGRVKVLDFGLAKALTQGDDDSTRMDPTLTQAGVVMGTPAYMSPEQARGEPVGPQTDIWAFGVLLFEMLSANSPFARSTAAETLSQVLASEPDYSRLPASVPAAIQRLVRRCLQKDPQRRLQHMGDIRIEIEESLHESATSSAVTKTGATVIAQARRKRVWAGMMVAIAGISGLVGWFVARQSTPSLPGTFSGLTRVSLQFLEPPQLITVGSRHLAISDDGSRLVYSSQGQLWLRRMEEANAVSIGKPAGNPAFSPDGQWVCASQNQMAKIPVDGGKPVPLARTTARPAGCAWSKDGRIAFATTEGLYLVSENGGDARLLAQPRLDSREQLYAWPEFLPNGRSLLFTIISQDAASAPTIAVLDLETLKIEPILNGGSSARYVSTVSGGRLIYASGSALKAIAFDLRSLRTVGEPVSFPDIQVATAADNGAADFAVSPAGTLAFISTQATRGLNTLQWIDRNGKTETLAVEPRAYAYARVSPQGDRVALDLTALNGNRDIWILDLKRMSQVQLTDGPTEDGLPSWPPDGRRVFFASDRKGDFDIYSQPADGATGPKVEFAGPDAQMPHGFTPDGLKLMVYHKFNDIGVLDLSRPNHMEILLDTDVDVALPTVSPDGKWLLYESMESGNRHEIFLRPYPNAKDRRIQVSINGGRYPLWRKPNTNELYYVNLDGDMMAVSIELEPDLKLKGHTKLFHWEKPPEGRTNRKYDVSPVDGRFLTIRNVETQEGVTNVSLIMNWLAEVERRSR